MRDGFLTLTEREKETLRLLVRGYDAKSIAQRLGLSVHTVNERLRDARRKLGVASSREAARLLAETERDHPDFFVYNKIGVSEEAGESLSDTQTRRRPSMSQRLVWLSGGMLAMSLVIATAITVSVLHGSAAPGAPREQAASSPAPVVNASAAASLPAARDWVALVDGHRWEESWRVAATLFRSQISAAQWVATLQSVREPLGAVSSRSFQNVTKTKSLPGAPAGDYEVLQFQTNFAHRPDTVETIILAHESGGWRVAGYYIR
ncbi:DUF4019 domain-containing protein [Sphingomonas psychrotolerans]|uniref:DUF4019 domain-containing protein n=1 Tax=Sphingomonas psychrotolerans TaxID=1327635 RepID=A0ABU3N0V6_9SPHN|nr:DUF4019 domain-containing protein [Sphingomonas psychrotolerans]MDT8757397.1 DUF4019 domain-containing protein [Sphingomonas psychrotolerans]